MKRILAIIGCAVIVGTVNAQVQKNDSTKVAIGYSLGSQRTKERLGESGQAELDLVRKRATVSLKPCTLENLLDERMLELCWEGWRRQDFIRFGKYRSLYTGPDAVDESDGHTTVFPIPGDVVTLNNKIHQNKGY